MSDSVSIPSASTTISPAELLCSLLQFNTTNPPGNEEPCLLFLKGRLERNGFETSLYTQKAGRPNLITRLPGAGNAPPLLLYGHVDVVPTDGQAWQHPPFSGYNDGEYIWGRGALDMKGPVAMMISALLRLKEQGITLNGDIILVILSDEEAGGIDGAKFLTEQHPELFAGVRHAIGEFGGFSLNISGKRFYPIMVAEKASCRVVATVRGPGGHGSMPVRGGAMARAAAMLAAIDSATFPVHIHPVVVRMVELISGELPIAQRVVFKQLLHPSRTKAALRLMGAAGESFAPLLCNTVSPTIIKGSEKINVIPAEVRVEMDARLLPGSSSEEFLAELRAVVGSEIELTLEEYEPAPAHVDLTLIPLLTNILRTADPSGTPIPFMLPAVTDARFFARIGIQTYGFTPMQLPAELNFTRLIHAADERIPVAALEFGTHCIVRVLEQYAG